jgi:glycosyltransferase involved in cell wall biosynthesis
MEKFIKHIVIINDFGFINGGAGQIAIKSAAALASAGHKVIFFTSVPPIDNDLNHPNLRVECTFQKDILNNPNRLKASLQGIWNFHAAKSFESILNGLEPESTIIHIHSWIKALSPSIIKIANKKKFKIVMTVHDYFLACPNGGFFNYPKNEICHLTPLSWRCVLENCDSRNYFHKLWRVLRHIVQNSIGNVTNKIQNYIFVSEFSFSILKSFMPNNANIFFLNNPINQNKKDPVNVETNNLFVFVGRLAKEKGVTLLARAASQLGIDIVFIGDGELSNKIIDIYPQSKITGWIKQAEISNYLNSARALVFPSLWYETQGLVVNEAAGLGLPAIVSNTSAASEFITDGVTGLLFKRGDVDDLINKIKILQNSAIAKKIGLNTYNNFWSNPPLMQNHIKGLIDIYQHVLQN